MCNPNDPPVSAIIAEETKRKQSVYNDTSGWSPYLDHLAERIQDGRPRKIVYVHKTIDFSDVPVGLFVREYRFVWPNLEPQPWQTDVIFDLPDEVVRRVQSEHSRNFMRELVGLESPFLRLKQPVRPDDDYDSVRQPPWTSGLDSHAERRRNEYLTDPKEILAALKDAAGDSGLQLGGKRVAVIGDHQYSHSVRVTDTEIQLKLDRSLSDMMIGWWARRLREYIGLLNPNNSMNY